MVKRSINVFLFGNEAGVQSIGWRVYRRAGDDRDIVTFLRERAPQDHQEAPRTNLEKTIPWSEFEVMNRLNPLTGSLVARGVIDDESIYCLTRIVNGEIRIEEMRDEVRGEVVPDYLDLYMTENRFDFPQLIQDDYFDAIHMLWNRRKYVSCLKLVFSAIDTFGYIAYGPGRGRECFVRWLDDYCPIQELELTSSELWELRNSLVHMTNLDSHQVRSRNVRRLLPYINHPDRNVPTVIDDMKVFHVARFVCVVLPHGIEHWLRSYNSRPRKFSEFVERYDTIVSEARLTPSTPSGPMGRTATIS